MFIKQITHEHTEVHAHKQNKDETYFFFRKIREIFRLYSSTDFFNHYAQ